MHFKLVALLAFVVEAMAAAGMENMPGMEKNPPPAPPATTPPPGVNQGDLLRVLLTALPPSLLNIALTNQPAVSSIIASEFRAGVTEPWFKSLPAPVQTYLANQGTPGAGPSPTTPAAPFINMTTPGATTPSATTPRMTMSPTSNKTMSMTSTMTTFESGTSSMENMPATTPASNQTSTAGAMPLPLPTAAIGAGVAGALGIMGILGL